MATTSIWRVHGRIGKVLLYAENPDKTSEDTPLEFPDGINRDALEDVMIYAARDDATNLQQYVYGINCSPETARDEMMAVKNAYEKDGGVIAYHGYQSFAEGEVTPWQAHQIGIKLAERLWGDRYQVLVATHLDKESHLHNHFVLNTVSFIDGKKYHRTTQDYLKMRNESDRLCLEYGLPIIELPAGKGKHYKEYLDEKAGKPTVRGMVREDIDKAIAASLTEGEFIDTLEEMGYTLKLLGDNGRPLKYPALHPPGAKGFFRFHKLGPGYALEDISERILKNYRRTEPFPEAELEAARVYRRNNKPREKLKGLQALYIRYCYELHIIQKFPASAKRVSFYMREDLTKLDKLDAEVRFLTGNGIETIEDLNKFQTESKDRVSELLSDRQKLRNEVRRKTRAGDTYGAVKIRAKISGITEELKDIRKSLWLCEDISARSAKMADALDDFDNEMEKSEKKEGNYDEQLFSGRGRTGREDDIRRQ
ncbi:MAG: relaxase/mobilization nuclease domain-containing protein [Firmicutes bacterium]|nr:relaxase/mobilization nuclease domain-containing protein [Bacillota bacterium]